MQDAVEDQRRCGSSKRQRSCGHLIQHHAEREQVRPRVQFFTACLLWRHIRNRPHRTARTRQLMLLRLCGLSAHRARARRLGGRLKHGRKFREAKIQNLRLPAFHQKYIRRLDVAMHDSLGMRRIQSAGNLNSDLQQLAQLGGLPGDKMFKRLAFQQLHGDERSPFELSNVVNRADIRMV